MIKIIKKQKIDHNQIPSGYTMFVFGHPKTHKTTELSKWSPKGSDGVLLIDLEHGGEYVEGANRVVVTSIYAPERIKIDPTSGIAIKDKNGLTTMEPVPPEERGFTYRTGELKGQPMPVYSLFEVLDYIEEHINDKDFPYETIVLDTMDVICEMFQDIICEELALQTFGTADWGRDIGMLKEKSRILINMFRDVLIPKGKNLILVSHSKDKVKFESSGKDGKGKSTIQLSSTLYAGVSNIISSLSEMIGYVSLVRSPDGSTEAQISFDNTDEEHIGSRIKSLAGTIIPFSYDSFEKAIKEYKGE